MLKLRAILASVITWARKVWAIIAESSKEPVDPTGAIRWWVVEPANVGPGRDWKRILEGLGII